MTSDDTATLAHPNTGPPSLPALPTANFFYATPSSGAEAHRGTGWLLEFWFFFFLRQGRKFILIKIGKRLHPRIQEENQAKHGGQDQEYKHV